MTFKFRHSAFGAFSNVQYQRLYWLNIDVTLRQIFVRQRNGRNRIFTSEIASSSEYCVLHGVGAVANALTIGNEGLDFDRFFVEISGYFESEGLASSHDLRPPARMVWNKVEDRSPQLDIFIPNNLLRHLTELFVTKRIDNVQMAMLIAVIGSRSETLDDGEDRFPLLGKSEHLFFRRVQCELLSVYTSLGKS